MRDGPTDAELEDAVDEIMQDVTAFILEQKIDSELAQEFVRQTAERAKKRLKIHDEAGNKETAGPDS